MNGAFLELEREPRPHLVRQRRDGADDPAMNRDVGRPRRENTGAPYEQTQRLGDANEPVESQASSADDARRGSRPDGAARGGAGFQPSEESFPSGDGRKRAADVSGHGDSDEGIEKSGAHAV